MVLRAQTPCQKVVRDSLLRLDATAPVVNPYTEMSSPVHITPPTLFAHPRAADHGAHTDGTPNHHARPTSRHGHHHTGHGARAISQWQTATQLAARSQLHRIHTPVNEGGLATLQHARRPNLGLSAPPARRLEIEMLFTGGWTRPWQRGKPQSNQNSSVSLECLPTLLRANCRLAPQASRFFFGRFHLSTVAQNRITLPGSMSDLMERAKCRKQVVRTLESLVDDGASAIASVASEANADRGYRSERTGEIQ